MAGASTLAESRLTAIKKSLAAPMAASYMPQEVESEWSDWWSLRGYFTPSAEKARNSSPAKKFVMVIPPPNVTGSLHIGHALTLAIQDALTRWHRMKGDVALWVPGTDHAGIATQSVVERHILKTENKSRHEFGREEFVRRIWDWKTKYGDRIYQQMKNMGTSVDWTRDVFTLDKERCYAVNEAFIRFFDAGLIYRSNRLVSWCSHLQTALSEIEVDTEEIEHPQSVRIPGYDKTVEIGYLWTFTYKIKDSEETISVATTRIETMLGDTAVAVHPEDERYKHLIGQQLIHPFAEDRIMHIIPDESVVKEFGTGAVKITPAHDRNDYEVGLRHNLEMITIFTLEGFINENGGKFCSMHRFDCRRAIEVELKNMGLLKDKGPNMKKMQLPRCSRSGDIIEYMLLPQWYVNCSDMASRAVRAVKENELKIQPSLHKQTWYKWLEDCKDWCISRQLWWGHRIPAYRIVHPLITEETWVCGHSYEEALANAKQKVSFVDIALEQDEDVLDTWFSSGLFPFSVMGWPNATEDMSNFFPNTLLETGQDILFFWVARMVMMSLQLCNSLPFSSVFLHAMVRDAHGQKMSKSKGNVIDPLDVIYGISKEKLLEKVVHSNLAAKEVERAMALQQKDFPKGIAECGADALRYGLLAYTHQARNINLDINRIIAYRHFCNKLWNAVRFALKSFPTEFRSEGVSFSPTTNLHWIDTWILHRLSVCAKEANNSFEGYAFGEVVTSTYNFWLYDLCDVYLEAIKPRLHESPNGSHTALLPVYEVLYTCLDVGLRLLHPLMPFITEELYQRLPPSKTKVESICIAPYPTHNLLMENSIFDSQMSLLMAVIKQFRSLTANLNIHPRERLNGFVQCKVEKEKEFLKEREQELCTLAKLRSVTILAHTETEPPNCAGDIVNEKLHLFLECDEVVDLGKVDQKLKEKITASQKMLSSYENKERVADYAIRVPEEVQRANKQRMAQLEEELRSLTLCQNYVARLLVK